MEGIGKPNGYRDTHGIGSEYGKDLANKKRGQSGVEMADFFKLFAAQMQNQDFMNPMDNSQFLTQMAQFQTMQAMQNLEAQMHNSFAIGMIGKTVVCADYDKDGALKVTEGVVERVSLAGGRIRIKLKGHDGKSFEMKNIMEVKSEMSKPAEKPNPDGTSPEVTEPDTKPDVPKEDGTENGQSEKSAQNGGELLSKPELPIE